MDVQPNDKDDGIEQLKSYLAACPNAEFGLWTNGQDRFCFRRSVVAGKVAFDEITDLPVKGKSLDEAEKPTLSSLKAATSDALLFTFRRCHNYIAGNQGLQKPDAFWEFLKIIFCKIDDERSDELQFYATTQERKTLNGQLKVKSRIDRLFSEVRDRYSNIFKQNEIIDLEPRVRSYAHSGVEPLNCNVELSTYSRSALLHQFDNRMCLLAPQLRCLERDDDLKPSTTIQSQVT